MGGYPYINLQDANGAHIHSRGAILQDAKQLWTGWPSNRQDHWLKPAGPDHQLESELVYRRSSLLLG
ncbi:hypothetical protein B0H12DRAFT_1137657 [Mycena haematopus]|nr:hypothetical protein B0H12DRAFT_1137657 [Mycena haematopus]